MSGQTYEHNPFHSLCYNISVQKYSQHRYYKSSQELRGMQWEAQMRDT